jgi:hypothetical protein
MPKSEFHYDIEQNFDTISSSESSRGNTYAKEVNLISYNDGDPVYDIRNWTIGADGTRRMGKGITMSLEEMKKLKDILNDMADLED